ncbi:hypothetical protein [Prevotella sp.]|uniref:hypothetical protein n=1 Tax=Prevotella sp. TaxID=59823 RepID=UPI002F94E974
MFNLTFRHYGQLVKFYNVNVRCDIKLFRADGSFVKVLQSLPLSVNHSNIYFYHNFTDAGEYKLQFQLSGLNLEGRIRNTKGEYINTNTNTPYAIWKLDADYTITRTLIDD